MVNETYYKNNEFYSTVLEKRSREDFKKYTDNVDKFVPQGGKFLDIGCGTGIAMSLIKKNVEVFGVDVAETSIKKCKEKNLNCMLYDGGKLPYPDNFFDISGSYNVLEHVTYPFEFLQEQLRVVKNGGFIIVVCPNFLSITNNYHHHTRGILQKIKNIFGIIKRLISRSVFFEKMETVVSDNFVSDDDACNITNPLDILRWSKVNKLKLCYWSAFSLYRKGLISRLDYSMLRLFLGSSFFVFQKHGNKK